MIQRVALSLSVIVGMATAGCGPSQKFVPPDMEELARRDQEALANLEKVRAEIKQAEEASAQSALGAASKAMAAVGEIEEQAPPDLCWQDYCPCEETETALDVTICRNARGGVAMSDEQWAIGAQARDSKRQGDRLNAEMDDIMADDRAQREQLRANAERFDY